jgi:hypothetical protein
MRPDFEKLSVEKALRLFKQWGFLIEQGPRCGQVTLMLEGPDHRSYYVCEATHLPQMAASCLRVRWRRVATISPVLDVQ